MSTDAYPHETREYVPVTVRNGTTVITTGVELALIPAGGRPADTDYTGAVTTSTGTAILLDGQPAGSYQVWARITIDTQLIVIEGPFVEVS